jgi:hypothetical protein
MLVYLQKVRITLLKNLFFVGVLKINDENSKDTYLISQSCELLCV